MVRFPIKCGGVDQERTQDHEEVGLPASMLPVACCYITISQETQVIGLFVTTPKTPALCCASSVSGVIPVGLLIKEEAGLPGAAVLDVRDDFTT